MKTLIIAEKPKVAKAIMEMLQCKYNESFRSCGGEYHESSNYLISSFFGHLLELYMPDDYGYKEWKAEDLPIIPEKFLFKYKGDCATRGKLLVKLAKESSLIVEATDGDREGEGIFRSWYEYEKITTPFKRIWPKALPVEDLAKAWSKMEDSSKYDLLGEAQKLRQMADWLIGMNGSRAYSIAGNDRISIGRVQTATLALIVKRDSEVENHKESFFYTLNGEWKNLPFIYFDDNGTKFEDKDLITKVKNECIGKQFSLKSFKNENKTENAPLPFSLHELQKVANQKLGFTLDKTLSLSQLLYEKSLTTYPRTSSPYLPPSDIDNYYKIIDTFANADEKALIIEKGRPVQCLKETDASHTAIIPTGTKPDDSLPADEALLFNLIIDRFIISFCKPRLYIQYSIIISDGTHSFRSIVCKTTDYGFTRLLKKEEGSAKDKKETKDSEESENEENEIIWELSAENLAGEALIKDLTILEKRRSKPKYYTPATLLTAMINVGRTIDNKEFKEILSEVEGLGTEATRDKFPLELEKRGYIATSGKFLISTIKGRRLIAWVKPELKTPELTASWEKKLRDVEKGKFNPDVFRKELVSFTREIIIVNETARNTFVNSVNESKRKCPKCKNPLKENSAGFFCSESCGVAVWKVVSEKKLSTKDIDALFGVGKTEIIDGFTKKDKSGKFASRLVLEAPDYKVRFASETVSEYTCLVCGKQMKSTSVNVKCDSCGLTVWLSVSEKIISENQVKQLLQNGKTSVIKGFIARSNGKPFDAMLVVDKINKKVVFEFPKK
jgi:DNA topoisomerase-3